MMNSKLEVAMYDSMIETEDLIETLQGRIYCFTCIPLEERDELSKKLYEIRNKLLDYSINLGKSLVTMGAFD